MTELTKNSHERPVNWIRFLYGGFVLISLYYVVIAKDYSTALTNLGIALAFDPFDQKITWNNRPVWQRIWLIVHLSIVIIGFIGILIWKSRH